MALHKHIGWECSLQKKYFVFKSHVMFLMLNSIRCKHTYKCSRRNEKWPHIEQPITIHVSMRTKYQLVKWQSSASSFSFIHLNSSTFTVCIGWVIYAFQNNFNDIPFTWHAFNRFITDLPVFNMRILFTTDTESQLQMRTTEAYTLYSGCATHSKCDTWWHSSAYTKCMHA